MSQTFVAIKQLLIINNQPKYPVLPRVMWLPRPPAGFRWWGPGGEGKEGKGRMGWDDGDLVCVTCACHAPFEAAEGC